MLHSYAGEGDLLSLPIDEILENRYELQKQVQLGENPICRKCRTLMEREWEQKEYLFDLISVQNDLRCNVKCEYCNFLVRWDDFEINYNTYKMYPLIKQLVDEKLLSPEAQIFWAGGEPSILDEFTRCLDILFSYSDKLRLQIATNATTLPVELQEICKKYGKQIRILCSLDSGTKEIYKAVKTKDYFDDVIQNLRIYKKYVRELVLKMIITETNYIDVEAFLDIACELNLKQVFYDIDFTQDMNKIPEEILDAMARMSLTALTKGIVAAPMSIWQFYDIVGTKLETVKRRYIKDTLSSSVSSSNIKIKVEGKNEEAFSNEVFIVNISSNNSPVLVDWNWYADTHSLFDSAESPMGKKLLLSEIGENIEITCNDNIMYIWGQCSKWGGIMSIEKEGKKKYYDLYSTIAENKMFVYNCIDEI